MTTKEAKGVSLADLDLNKAGEQTFEFEYLIDGAPTGVFFQVYGSHTKQVQDAINREVNERRKRDAVTEARNRGARPGSAEFTPVEDDVAFGQRLAAVRLAGWRGIVEPFSPAGALAVCQGNPDIAAQVTEEANRTGNFLKLSPAK